MLLCLSNYSFLIFYISLHCCLNGTLQVAGHVKCFIPENINFVSILEHEISNVSMYK